MKFMNKEDYVRKIEAMYRKGYTYEEIYKAIDLPVRVINIVIKMIVEEDERRAAR